jgi:hypothetical protein
MTRHIPLALVLAALLSAGSGCCLLCQSPNDCADCGVASSGCAGLFEGDIACGGPVDDCGGPACEGAGDVACGGPCAECGPCFPLLGWVFHSLALGCHGHGCGEVYWNGYYNDPPDACEPCDGCGNWTGSTGLYRAPYRNGPYGSSPNNMPHLATAPDMPVDDYPGVDFDADPPPTPTSTFAPIHSTRRPSPPAVHWR